MKRKRKCVGICGAKTLQIAAVDSNNKPVWICNCCGVEIPRCAHNTAYADGQCAVCGKYLVCSGQQKALNALFDKLSE